jgi:hypothetical protein
MAEQNIAVRRAYLPKRHAFRREFEQRDEQLTLTHAGGVKNAISAILFLRNRAATRIDFFCSPNERLFEG